MKQVLKMKAMGLLILLLSLGYLQAQSLTPQDLVRQGELADPNTVSSDEYDASKDLWVLEHPELYDQMLSTETPNVADDAPWGDPVNKDSWAQEHPREYAAYFGNQVDTRVHMTQTEFNALPLDKQQAILIDPNFVIID